MIIELKKFGTTLTSREEGREAFAAFKPSLNSISDKESVELVFTGVNTISPAWGDEFLTPLFRMFGIRLVLKDTTNLSVDTTITTLEKIHQVKYNRA